MKFYKLTYVPEDEYVEKLAAMAERYKKVNGWSEKDMLQFAVTALIRSDMQRILNFLEVEINRLEKNN